MRKYWMFSTLCLLWAFSSCHIRPKGDKYYLKIKVLEKSVLGMDTETKLDSIFAPNINAAYDSLSLWVVSSIQAFEAVERAMGDPISIYNDCDLLDANGVSVLDKVDPRIKDSLDKKWGRSFH